MRKKIICDIDGVLNNPKKIAYLYHEEKYDEMVEASLELPVDQAMADIIRLLANIYDIIFLTGRQSKYRNRTKKFLDQIMSNIPYQLAMRSMSDFSSSSNMKLEWIDQNLHIPDIAFAIEDRRDIAEAYERNCIKCLIVNTDYFSKEK